MPRFVILEHDHPVRHFDLMLETGSILRTWRLVEPPQPGKWVVAEPSFDHRVLYLDYEGPVSGDRGNVKRLLAGTFELVRESGDLIEAACQVAEASTTILIKRMAEGGWVVQITAYGE